MQTPDNLTPRYFAEHGAVPRTKNGQNT